MDYRNYPNTGSSTDFRNAVKKDLIIDNYDPDARPGDKGWSLSEFVENDDRVALTAITLLHGRHTSGRALLDGEGIDQMNEKRNYRLQVLTRQACYADKDGNVFASNPIEPGCPDYNEKPVAGDVVKVKGNMYSEDPATGRKLSRPGVRNDMQRRGKDLYSHRMYKVDGDGCITLEAQHAFQLLKQSGFRLVPVEFRKLNSNIRTEAGGIDKKQRKITNWRFREVAEDFKAEKKVVKPQQAEVQATLPTDRK